MRELRDKSVNSVSKMPTKTEILGLNLNLAGVLCYAPFFVGLVCSIIWVAKEPRSNKFVRFHAIQSLCLTIVGLVPCVVLSILSMIGLGAITSVLSTVVSLALLAACVICMIKAWKNEMFKLPVIGDFASDKA